MDVWVCIFTLLNNNRKLTCWGVHHGTKSRSTAELVLGRYLRCLCRKCDQNVLTASVVTHHEGWWDGVLLACSLPLHCRPEGRLCPWCPGWAATPGCRVGREREGNGARECYRSSPAWGPEEVCVPWWWKEICTRDPEEMAWPLLQPRKLQEVTG